MVADILKMANACTLFVANELTSIAENGVNKLNSTAIGTYSRYENWVFSTNPERGGKISKTINEKKVRNNIR